MNPEPLTIIALNLETYIPHPYLPPKQGDRGGLLHLLPSGRLRGGLLFFRLEEPRFFLSEKGALIRDNDIRCKAGSMLAYM